MAGPVKIDFPNVETLLARDGSVRGYTFRRRRRLPDGTIRVERTRLPDDPTSPEFAAALQRLNGRRVEPPASPTPYSFAALIASYRLSPRYRRLAARTKKDYDSVLRLIEQKAGEVSVIAFRRADVVRMRDALAPTPRKANYAIQLMSILFGHARVLEWRTDNPCTGVELLQLEGRGYPPWPPWAISGVLAHITDPDIRLAMRLGLSIGPRPDDLIRLRWSDYDGEGIDYLPRKTKKRVWAPLLPEMRAILEAAKAEARGLTIIAQPNGQPYKYRWFMRQFDAPRDAAGAQEYTPHGWRKNATITLAEAGCSNDEIKAITGHSTDVMVDLYASGARRKALARAALEKVQRTPVASRVASQEKSQGPKGG